MSIDPLTVQAIRTVARELAVCDDDELALLGALVATLTDGLVRQGQEDVETMRKLVLHLELRNAREAQIVDELQLIRVQLRLLNEQIGGADGDGPTDRGAR